MANILTIADEVYRELGSPDDVSVPSIVFYLKSNVGNLNLLLGTELVVDGEDIVDADDVGIGVREANVYKKYYYVYWLQKQVKRYLGASATETVLSVDSDGSSVRRINKTTLASEYRQLAKDEESALDKLIQEYKQDNSLPRQVTGDDHIPASTYPNVPNYTVYDRNRI